jgi:hypothetical protein
MSAIKNLVNTLGLTAQLIPSPTNPLNCKYVIINGSQLKSSQWTKTQAENILLEYKEGGCKKQAIPDSINFETVINPVDELKKFIKFENNSLTNCLESFRQLTELSHTYSLNNWINTMTDFFTNDMSNKADTTACANKIKSMFENKEVRIINNFVYTTSELTLVIKTWQDINNIKANINYNIAIDKYINAVESLC